jgi:molybdenum cofactor cytidylyltransferase
LDEKPATPRVSAVILAAGTSSRMGAPKQLLAVGPGAEETLLGRVIENVRRSHAAEIVVVLGHAADEIRRRVSLEGVRVVMNKEYREGMGFSLRVGLGAVDERTEAALIVLADQPFIRPATLDRLIEEYGSKRPQIAIPVYRGFRGNPVLLDRSVFSEVMELHGDIGCRAIFGSHLENILKVPVEDAGILADIDEAGDLEKLRSFAERSEAEPAILGAVDLAGRERLVAEETAGWPELVLVGHEAVSLALAKLARVVNFSVTFVDPLLSPGELPEADRVLRALDFSLLPANRERYVVVASQGKFDEEAVEQALAADAAYVALVSREARAQEILRSLGMKGIAHEKLERVRAPAGINIGAQSPEEIALSILAEIVAERRRPTSTSRDKRGR